LCRTAEGGLIALSDAFGRATAVSTDGNTIVGFVSALEGTRLVGKAFRWTEGEGMLQLGGTGVSEAVDVSADGSVIVGHLTNRSGFGAPFYWTPSRGLQEIDSLLSALGADVSGWQFREVVAVSDDGHTIIGNGSFRDGVDQAWIAFIPEPSPILLVGVGLAALALRRAASRSYHGEPPSWRARRADIEARA
jgi:uncharacterized membrane protein